MKCGQQQVYDDVCDYCGDGADEKIIERLRAENREIVARESVQRELADANMILRDKYIELLREARDWIGLQKKQGLVAEFEAFDLLKKIDAALGEEKE